MKNLEKCNQKGITLIALVVTITVLIILATVSINTVLGDNGIIKRAQKARDSYQNSSTSEDEYTRQLANEMAEYDEDENLGGNTEDDGGSTTVEIIDKTKSYVGYYADIDGDETVDGIIYADLAVGGSGQWVNSNGIFSYEAITGVKDYTISQTSYSGNFGKNGVLKATGSGKDRFYVMALSNINSNTYAWYENAYTNKISDHSTVTSTSFGSGKTNTATMIAKWNSNAYGEKVDTDMWKIIQTQVNKGWFVPSKEEWSAFGNNLSIDGTNHTNYNLSAFNWSSSLGGDNLAWFAQFQDEARIRTTGLDNKFSIPVRLSTTF